MFCYRSSNHSNTTGNSSQKHHKRINSCNNSPSNSNPNDLTNSALHLKDNDNELLNSLSTNSGHCSKALNAPNSSCSLQSNQSTSANVIINNCILGNNNLNNNSSNSSVIAHTHLKKSTIGDGISNEDIANDDDRNSYSGYNSGDEHSGQKYDLTLDEWAERDRQFIKLMNDQGFVVEEVAEDGACLFRSISLQIFGDQDMHEIIRQQTMDYIVS